MVYLGAIVIMGIAFAILIECEEIIWEANGIYENGKNYIGKNSFLWKKNWELKSKRIPAIDLTKEDLCQKMLLIFLKQWDMNMNDCLG